MTYTPPPLLPCKPGKQHRFIVAASIKGFKNCLYCGQTKKVD
jgi:hypothetical protein